MPITYPKYPKLRFFNLGLNLLLTFALALSGASCSLLKKGRHSQSPSVSDHERALSGEPERALTDAEISAQNHAEGFPEEFGESDDDLSAYEEEPLPAPELTPEFCRQWNPEYLFRGNQCCASMSWRGKRKRRSCSPKRRSGSFCNELTAEQKLMIQPDFLDHLDPRQTTQQAFCSPDTGFLAHGVPLIPTTQNRVLLNNAKRCSNFGTAGLIRLLDQLGHAVDLKFKGQTQFNDVRLVVGDIAAPRGGCLPTSRGAHSGHTNGLDADVGFLMALPDHSTDNHFHGKMDLELNWWFLKTIAAQSQSCVKYIFLDRSHIHRLKKFATQKQDPDWALLAPVLKHAAGHRNHFHIRIGLSLRSNATLKCAETTEANLLKAARGLATSLKTRAPQKHSQ